MTLSKHLADTKLRRHFWTIPNIHNTYKSKWKLTSRGPYLGPIIRTVIISARHTPTLEDAIAYFQQCKSFFEFVSELNLPSLSWLAVERLPLTPNFNVGDLWVAAPVQRKKATTKPTLKFEWAHRKKKQSHTNWIMSVRIITPRYGLFSEGRPRP